VAGGQGTLAASPPALSLPFLPTRGHGADEHRVEFEHGAEGLLVVQRAQRRLAVALEHQFLVLLLQQDQEVFEEQHVQVWGGRGDGERRLSQGRARQPAGSSLLAARRDNDPADVAKGGAKGVPVMLLGLGVKCLAAVLCPLLWVTLLGQGVGLGDPQRALPTPNIL